MRRPGDEEAGAAGDQGKAARQVAGVPHKTHIKVKPDVSGELKPRIWPSDPAGVAAYAAILGRLRR